jgi:hypothetical protein
MLRTNGPRQILIILTLSSFGRLRNPVTDLSGAIKDRNSCCSSAPYSGCVPASSGEMTTAPTLSWGSRPRSLTPWVLRPTARMDLAPMRMILPNWLMTMSSLVSSTRLMPVTFPILRAVFKTEFQNGNPSKINPEKVACFSSPNPDHQLTSFHQQSTTTSPQKNHIQTPVFAKTPSKNKLPPPPKTTAKHPSSGGVLAPSGDDGGSYFVRVLELEDLGGAQPAQALRPRRMARNVPEPKARKFSLEKYCFA